MGVFIFCGSIAAWKVTTFLTLSAKPDPILSFIVRQLRRIGCDWVRCLFEFPLKPLRDLSFEFESEGVEGWLMTVFDCEFGLLLWNKTESEAFGVETRVYSVMELMLRWRDESSILNVFSSVFKFC